MTRSVFETVLHTQNILSVLEYFEWVKIVSKCDQNLVIKFILESNFC